MAKVKTVSDIKKVVASAECVYTFFSDFENVERFFSKISQNIPEADQQKITEQVEGFSATKDSCKFIIKKYGEVGLDIIDKEMYKTIKYQANAQSPVPLTLWLQLVSVSDFDTRIRLTLHAELNMMMKMMLKDKLKKGLNQLAEQLSMIPYQQVVAEMQSHQ